MTRIAMKPATRADAADLIRGNTDSRLRHEPWVRPFTDAEGLEDWLGGLATRANIGLVTREARSGGIVGVVNLSQIFLKGFQNAYVGYYGMAGFAGRGVGLSAGH